MTVVRQAIDRMSGKRTKKETGKKKRLSPCHDQPLVRRKLWSKCWICQQCWMACGSSKYEQLQIDMK